jgi:hypothetical protein
VCDKHLCKHYLCGGYPRSCHQIANPHSCGHGGFSSFETHSGFVVELEVVKAREVSCKWHTIRRLHDEGVVAMRWPTLATTGNRWCMLHKAKKGLQRLKAK